MLHRAFHFLSPRVQILKLLHPFFGLQDTKGVRGRNISPTQATGPMLVPAMSRPVSRRKKGQDMIVMEM